MANPLRRSGVFPPIVIRMIAAGEKSGKLEDMLSRVATAYDQEVETRVTALTAFLEPLMILAMGLVVGFIVLAILLPIFEMSRVIR
jgi:general secretion pathway protein F